MGRISRRGSGNDWIIIAVVEGEEVGECLCPELQEEVNAPPGNNDASTFQVLVGRQSSLLWVSNHGQFNANSMNYNPVPSGSDKEVDALWETRFVARFSHSGKLYVTDLIEGANSMWSP